MSVIFWLYHVWFWDSILIGWIKKRSWLYILKVWVQVKYSTKYNLILEWAKGFFYNNLLYIIGEIGRLTFWGMLQFELGNECISKVILLKTHRRLHWMHTYCILKGGNLQVLFEPFYLTRIYSLKYSSLIGKLVKQGDMVK